MAATQPGFKPNRTSGFERLGGGGGGGGGEGRGMEYRRHSAGSVAELKLLETRRCGSVHLGAVLVD